MENPRHPQPLVYFETASAGHDKAIETLEGPANGVRGFCVSSANGFFAHAAIKWLQGWMLHQQPHWVSFRVALDGALDGGVPSHFPQNSCGTHPFEGGQEQAVRMSASASVSSGN